MDYKPEHAARALRIVEDLMPHVSPHPLYTELAGVIRDSTRWHEAHDLLSSIRTEITLPNEGEGKTDLDSLFAYVAENAAKTAYNCSGKPAPFDEYSFDRLLQCENEFHAELSRQ